MEFDELYAAHGNSALVSSINRVEIPDHRANPSATSAKRRFNVKLKKQGRSQPPRLTTND